MDVEKLIEVAEQCKKANTCAECDADPCIIDCYNISGTILAVRDHVAAETRKQIIAEVREWANNAECDSMDDYKNDGYSMAIIDL